MRVRFFHHVRLLLVALAAVCAGALNHRHLAVVRVVATESAPASSRTVVTASKRVIVRERVSLESTHADAVTVAGPATAWLPAEEPLRNPLGTWLRANAPVFGALPAPLVRALAARAVPAFARLLGASVAPQAP